MKKILYIILLIIIPVCYINCSKKNEKKGTDYWIKKLQDKDFNVRAIAMDSLLAMGEQSVDPLIDFLSKNQKDKTARADAAEILGRLQSKRAVDVLINALKDEHFKVRENVTYALGQIGDNKAVEPLIKSLSDKNQAVREGACWALGQIGDKRAIDSLKNSMRTDKNISQGMIKSALTLIYKKNNIEIDF